MWLASPSANNSNNVCNVNGNNANLNNNNYNNNNGVNDKIRMYKKWNLTMYKNVQR